MNEATVTFTVEEDLIKAFAAAAKSRDRTDEQLLRDFMRDFGRTQEEAAGHDAWFRRQVQAGLDAADAGDVITDDEVEVEVSLRQAVPPTVTSSIRKVG
jgi:predicted transcriptional regulator